MEQLFYKIRLANGRVIGPIDLERVKLFIYKGQVSGLEVARLYPTGDWKDINTFPEIAELLMQKLEGKLELDASRATSEPDMNLAQAEPPEAPASSTSVAAPESVAPDVPEPPGEMPLTGLTIEQIPAAPRPTQTGTPSLEISKPGEPLGDSGGATRTVAEGERTVVMTGDDERTMIYDKDDHAKANLPALEPVQEINSGPIEPAIPSGETEVKIDYGIANEKTAMLSYQRPEAAAAGQKIAKPPASQTAAAAKKKKIFTILVMAALLVLVLIGSEDKKTNVEPPFRIEMPTNKAVDPQASEKIYLSGLPIYAQDTVESYKKAARIFLDAASRDPNNVRALCMLASAYMNLIDVVMRDENYFNVITRLIELARAKGVDMAETVISDVELYHILGNPDAAITRIVEYTKTHTWGVEMLYYLGMSFYLKGRYPEALNQLNKIDPKDYFSPKISYLYGLIFEKNGQSDQALKAYLDAVSRSPKHIKARSKVAELYFSRDNLPEASKNADFVIHNASSASNSELARAYYIRARMHQIGARDTDALSDLETALKRTPDDQDILLDYYTLKAKMGSKVKDASGKAKMFYFMAQGEKALKGGDLDGAMSSFLSARDAQYDDPNPLVRIAEVFRRKGDMQAAKVNLGKAVALDKKRAELYPKYIKTLIDAYEFEDASKMLTAYKELLPPVATVDRLQGDYYFKQDKLQEALTYYKRALSSSNVDSSIYVGYANLMFKALNFRDAAFYYGLALRFDPFNVDATIGIGKALSELEGLDRGVDYVNNALELSPHKAALLNGIAEIYQRKGDNSAALKFAENALVTDPTFTLAHKTKGDAYAALEKTKEALDAYLTYTNVNPLDPTGQIERYRIYLKKLDLKAAKDSIQKVIDNYPKYPGAYYMLGELYREGQNYESALQAAEIEIKNNPGFISAYVLAGTAYNLMKDNTKAIAILNKALKLAPNHVPTLIQAGFANHMLKTYAAAQSMFERALQLDPGNPQIHKRLGSLYHDLGNRDRAKQHFRAYLDLYPDAPDRKDMEAYLNQ